ncbi:hypothetical protein FHT44_005134 [Mycolicibacterium sp. BK634]|uniref:hypothetical protein n=1 Tax=Mycolicibacterium sp. BK634 TaxID=2587099 RepID=UPI001606F78F|nr:hypothetical protein [Mycolicibacterium sp. BK634]MBB3752622.1 hypothetical protein [Mycolicibacterium sp. BK634]
MSWPKTPDGKYYLFEGIVRVPVDPSTGVAQLLLRPRGGMLIGVPPVENGEDGATPTIMDEIVLNVLDWDDENPDEATWTEISPNTYQLSLTLHKGQPGDSVAAPILSATDLTGTPTAKYVLAINNAGNGVEIVPNKVGDRYFPATINSISAGNANATLCSISIGPLPFDWRPVASGYCVITGTGADVQVDVLARLGNESTGNIVGRGTQRAGQYPATHILQPGIPAGSATDYDKVNAGQTKTIYFRAERQSGGDTFTTSSTTTQFRVEVQPIP